MTWRPLPPPSTPLPLPPNPQSLEAPAHTKHRQLLFYSALCYISHPATLPPLPLCAPDNCCAVSRGHGTGKTWSRAAADQGKRITKVCFCFSSVWSNLECSLASRPRLCVVVVLKVRVHICAMNFSNGPISASCGFVVETNNEDDFHTWSLVFGSVARGNVVSVSL